MEKNFEQVEYPPGAADGENTMDVLLRLKSPPVNSSAVLNDCEADTTYAYETSFRNE